MRVMTVLTWILVSSTVAQADEIIHVTREDLPAMGPYVPATRYGHLIFTSGQIPLNAETGMIDGEDIKTQTRVVLNNLKSVLEAAGSSPQQILRVTVYLQDPADLPAMNEVYADHFGENPPARTMVTGMDLPGPLLIEIDAIAVKNQTRQGSR